MLKALRKYGKTKNDLYRIEYSELKKKMKNRKKESHKKKNAEFMERNTKK